MVIVRKMNEFSQVMSDFAEDLSSLVSIPLYVVRALLYPLRWRPVRTLLRWWLTLWFAVGFVGGLLILVLDPAVFPPPFVPMIALLRQITLAYAQFLFGSTIALTRGLSLGEAALLVLSCYMLYRLVGAAVRVASISLGVPADDTSGDLRGVLDALDTEVGAMPRDSREHWQAQAQNLLTCARREAQLLKKTQ